MDQLLAYYERHRINDFPKRTNGTPDMRKRFNKRHLASLTLNVLPVSQPTAECPVCYETIEDGNGKGKVVLGCNHTFCVECFTKFMHQKNTCPLCRVPFMNRSFEHMDNNSIDDMVDAAMSLNVWRIDDQRSNEVMDISQIIEHHLTHMNSVNMRRTIDFVVDAIEHQSVMVAFNVREFFETQLFR